MRPSYAREQRDPRFHRRQVPAPLLLLLLPETRDDGSAIEGPKGGKAKGEPVKGSSERGRERELMRLRLLASLIHEEGGARSTD